MSDWHPLVFDGILQTEKCDVSLANQTTYMYVLCTTSLKTFVREGEGITSPLRKIPLKLCIFLHRKKPHRRAIFCVFCATLAVFVKPNFMMPINQAFLNARVTQTMCQNSA